MKKSRDHLIKFIFELIAAFSIVISLVWQIRVDAQQYEWNRKNETLHMLEQRDRGLMKTANARLQGQTHPDSLLNTILRNDSIREPIVRQLNQFERISIGCNIGIYDPEVVSRFIGTTFRDFHNRMKPFIDYQRKKSGNPRIYQDYEKCAESMEVTTEVE